MKDILLTFGLFGAWTVLITIIARFFFVGMRTNNEKRLCYERKWKYREYKDEKRKLKRELKKQKKIEPDKSRYKRKAKEWKEEMRIKKKKRPRFIHTLFLRISTTIFGILLWWLFVKGLHWLLGLPSESKFVTALFGFGIFGFLIWLVSMAYKKQIYGIYEEDNQKEQIKAKDWMLAFYRFSKRMLAEAKEWTLAFFRYLKWTLTPRKKRTKGGIKNDNHKELTKGRELNKR